MAEGSSTTWATSSVCSCVEDEYEPVEEDEQEAANIGFGIAISGGRDNPHFTNGDPVIIISDVVPNGPAWGLLQLNDRILSANNVSFENIDYSTAVDIIKNKDQINMIVKRRVAMPMLEFEQRTLKFTLSKSRKKDDFGIVVGCKFYIKEIRNPKLAEKDPGLREGDSILRVNGQSLDGATLEEVNKWLERSRDKLCLVIQRDVRRGTSRWPSQNTVYERVGSVSATPRHSPSPMLQHIPLSTRPDGSVERRVSSPVSSQLSNLGLSTSITQNSGGPLEYEYYTRQPSKPPDTNGVRCVVFRKVGGSVGVRVIGGNEVGIFVSAVAADSPAAVHGVCCGDRILEVNGRNMRGITREAAVQLLLGLDDRVALKLEHARADFEHVRSNQLGDNFYIRAHFSKEKKSSPLELSVNEGDIFHVTDTLFGGTVGLWQAARVYSAAENKGEPVKGVIPNQNTAEVIAQEYRAYIEAKQSKQANSGGTLLRRKFESKRTKSLPKNMICDPTELSANIPLPSYERVALNTPSFHRPLVLFGPLADIARQQLLSQFSARFAQPDSDGGVIRLSSVDHVIASMKHCILDISIESVERLQLAQYAPIVVLIDVENRSRIREIRKKANAAHLSSRKLAEHAHNIKKYYSHLLSATIDATHENGWFEALRELIVHLQQRRLWMPEFPPNLPLEDVLLFPLPKCDGDVDSLKKPNPPVSRGVTSPGYYHVKQLLDDESLYQDARLANEIANVRLREEARLREERARNEQGISHRLDDQPSMDYSNTGSNNDSVSSPAYNAKYHPLTPSTPKPSNIYGDSYVRNRWPTAEPTDAKSSADLNGSPLVNGNSERIRRNGSASPANASISLTVASSINGPSKSPTPRLDENENGKQFEREEEEPVVVEEAIALIGSEGGIIRCEQANVELRIPEGAIKDGEKHEIYVKVCREGESSPIDRSKGETLLSPLVMCGPQGLKFEKQCELRMPHTGVEADGQWSFSLKTGEGGEWKHMDIDDASKNDDRFLRVPITHF
ncbi:unnamed protein product [Caenorhabditis bovis]|uniref:Uncharacterized protein n=1 Tax=Caenorhabditis bovis TaxID=2654633 RepID=A0A8S1FE41_9PELO|nr:unnamed protein product [Caenorhabditis bovis]